MGGRMLPVECEHGNVIDGGDFYEPDDSIVGCVDCDLYPPGSCCTECAKRDAEIAILRATLQRYELQLRELADGMAVERGER